jgi:hypothetical protein
MMISTLVHKSIIDYYYSFHKDENDRKHLFEVFDRDKNGKVSIAEFLTTLAIIGKGTLQQKLEVHSSPFPHKLVIFFLYSFFPCVMTL